jgi:sarcosine oxidase subunit gamma
VADLALKAEPRLGGFQASIGGTELAEVTDLAIVSIAIPLHGETAFAAALSRAYGVERPAPGRSVLSADGRTRLLWTAPDQLFALLLDQSPKAADEVRKKLGGKAYVTLQSDNWVALRLAGGRAREALERICPLDLHSSVFGEGRVARTAMEHMGAFVLCEGIHAFLLLSAASSAQSFLHAVEISLTNVS